MPIPLTYYSFTETSIGVYKLINLSANNTLSYILSCNNGCGESNIILQGTLDILSNISTSTNSNGVVFSGLPDGDYTLVLKHDGQVNHPSIEIKHYANLESSILKDIKKIFGNCKDCSTPVMMSCLLNKINYYFILKGYEIKEHLLEDYKCSMIGEIDCTLNKELFYGKCEPNLPFIISFYYLQMYSNRDLVNKKEIYDYSKIFRYISSNIIKLN